MINSRDNAVKPKPVDLKSQVQHVVPNLAMITNSRDLRRLQDLSHKLILQLAESWPHIGIAIWIATG
jgi:hypothetical protein